MATVTGLTKDRMLAIEAESIVGGAVNPTTGHLILTKHDGSTIDAGPVVSTGNFVDVITNQTVAGVKTFSSAPVVPANSFPESAITNLVSDLAAKAADSAVVKLTGAQTIAGVKTFSSAPVVPTASFPESAITNLVSDLAAKAADSAVVHLTSAETLSGAKTFSGGAFSASGKRMPSVFNVGSPLNGTSPSAANQNLIQAGTIADTTSLGGDITITFPTAFPNGLLTVIAISGDAVAFGGHFALVSSTLASVVVRAMNAGSPFTSSDVRCNWYAIGW